MTAKTVLLQADDAHNVDELARHIRSGRARVDDVPVKDVARHQHEIDRWQETLAAVESAAQGEVVDAGRVHEWLKSWGTTVEREAPDTRR